MWGGVKQSPPRYSWLPDRNRTSQFLKKISSRNRAGSRRESKQPPRNNEQPEPRTSNRNPAAPTKINSPNKNEELPQKPRKSDHPQRKALKSGCPATAGLRTPRCGEGGAGNTSETATGSRGTPRARPPQGTEPSQHLFLQLPGNSFPFSEL